MSVKFLRWTKPLPLRQWSAVAYVWHGGIVRVSAIAMTFEAAKELLRNRAAGALFATPDAVYLENIGSVPALPEGGSN